MCIRDRLTALVRSMVSDIPVFAICHSTDLRQMRTHSLERDAIIEGIRSLTGVFALHGEQRSEIVDLYGCEPYNVQVLGTGYNSSVFKTSSPHSQEEGELSLLYVGKIWEKKGVGCLLDAVDQVQVPGKQDVYKRQSLSTSMPGRYTTRK